MLPRQEGYVVTPKEMAYHLLVARTVVYSSRARVINVQLQIMGGKAEAITLIFPNPTFRVENVANVVDVMVDQREEMWGKKYLGDMDGN